jgi:hypothetical protein
MDRRFGTPQAARAMAAAEEQPLYQWLAPTTAIRLPLPRFNIINGGAHAENPLAFQEFMVAPIGAPSFREALRALVEGLTRQLLLDGRADRLGSEGTIGLHDFRLELVTLVRIPRLLILHLKHPHRPVGYTTVMYRDIVHTYLGTSLHPLGSSVLPLIVAGRVQREFSKELPPPR